MKYQDFSSDKNIVSNEETIIIFISFTCEDVKVVLTTSVSANTILLSQHCACLPFSFTNQPHWLTRWNFQIIYLILAWIFLTSKMKGLMEGLFQWQIAKLLIWKTDQNAHTKNKKLVQEIIVLVLHRCLLNKQITCPLVDKNFYLLMFKSISHSFSALTREISSWTLNIKFISICGHVTL